MDYMFSDCITYDQDISTWKVPLISPPGPTGFDYGTPNSWMSSEKPNWGATC